MSSFQSRDEVPRRNDGDAFVLTKPKQVPDIAGHRFQLSELALLVEDLDHLQPARLLRIVQLAQVTQGPLARTVGGACGFDQRPFSPMVTSAVSIKLSPTSQPPISIAPSRHFLRGLAFPQIILTGGTERKSCLCSARGGNLPQPMVGGKLTFAPQFLGGLAPFGNPGISGGFAFEACGLPPRQDLAPF